MDENARRDPEDSGEESNGAIPPLILPPGNQQSHRTTNFYIDNILRPDFGRKRKGGTPIREAREVMGSAPKIANPDGQRSAAGGADGSPPTDDRRPDPLGRKGEPRDGEESEQLRGDDRSPCRSPRASGAAPDGAKQMLWPAWVYCTRYSDRPSSGPRSRKPKRARTPTKEDKRPRTAFSEEQLRRLKAEFQSERYLTEQRRRELAGQLALNESQIKIWFQNKRAKLKKATGGKNSLALHLMAQGLYNHASAKDAKSDSD